MKIAAGKWRQCNLTAPPASANVRPTSVRVRQSMFDILIRGRFGDCVTGAHVLDVFAGTGALALEALSQGAAHAGLIENSPQLIACIEANIDTVRAAAETLIVRADASRPPRRPPQLQPANLVLMDPPYGKGLAATALTALDSQGWLAPDVTVALEIDRREDFTPPGSFREVDSRATGPATIKILQRV